MPVALDIRHDISGAQAKLHLHEKAVMTAAVRAMNRTNTTVRKETANSLQEFYPGMKVSTLKAKLRMTKATRNKPESRLDPAKGRVPLMGNFGMARRGRFGVYFSKLPWRIETPDGESIPPQLLQTNAFVNPLQVSGRLVVFVRLGRRRLPIGVLLAPGPAKTIVEKGLRARMYRLGAEIFNRNFNRELAYAKSRSEQAE
jgi:hypothetical protein